MQLLTIDKIKASFVKKPNLSTEQAICWICHKLSLGEDVYLTTLKSNPPFGFEASDTICLNALKWLVDKGVVTAQLQPLEGRGRPRLIYTPKDIELINQLADLWVEFLSSGKGVNHAAIA